MNELKKIAKVFKALTFFLNFSEQLQFDFMNFKQTFFI